MIEDQLSHDERRRLESLAQAVAANRGGTAEAIVHDARRFDQWIRDGTW